MNVAYRRLNEAYDLLHDAPAAQVDAFVDQRIQDANSAKSLYRMWTPAGRGTLLADLLTGWLLPAVMASEEAVQRTKCTENIQRLALAILLYQHEHGKLPTPTPDENWAVQIKKYLGENPEQYFSCPTTPSPEGMTTYAMVQYGDTNGNTVDTPDGADSRDLILLIELKEAVPLSEAVISVDEVLELNSFSMVQDGKRIRRIYPHPGGMYVALRSGAVRFVSLSSDTSKAELLRLLGREEETKQPDSQSVLRSIEEAFGAVECDAQGTIIGVDLALERASATDEVLKLALTLPGLKKFRLAGSTISVEAFVLLQTQSNLEELFLHNLTIRDEDFLPVVSALPKLTRLTLRRLSNVSDMGIVPLFRFPALRQLSLIDMPLTGSGLQAIGESTTLVVFDVRDCAQLVPDDYKILLQRPQLVDLRIGGFAVNDQCLEIVAGLPVLRALTLEDSLVSVQGFEKFIADSLSAGTLETLVLNRNMSFTDNALLAIGNLPRLRRLILTDAMVTGVFLERLADDEQKRPQFNDLSLRKTLLTEEAIGSLVKYPELRSLQISGITLSVSVVETLLSLSQLERLDLTDCFSDDDVLRYVRELELPESLKSFRF